MKALTFLLCFFATYLAYAGVGAEVTGSITDGVTQAVLVYIAVVSSAAAFFLFKLIKYAITDKPNYYINRNNYNK